MTLTTELQSNRYSALTATATDTDSDTDTDTFGARLEICYHFFFTPNAHACAYISSAQFESNRIESKRIIRIAPWVCLRKRFEFIKIFVYLWLFLFSHFLLICKNSQRRQRISVLQMPKRQDKQKEEERKKRKEKKKISRKNNAHNLWKFLFWWLGAGKHFWFALKCTIWRFFSLIVCFGGLW